MGELRQKVVKGAMWAYLERLSTQMASFVIGMVLSRLLTPTDYGTVALIGIFLSIAGVLASSGFGSALVQKKDATEVDYNSVFYLSLCLSGVLYLILFVAAPYIADFYHSTELRSILRVMAISLFFSAINSVQDAELSRKMLFHLSFRISLIGLLASAIVGLTLAWLGYGPWAIVWSGIASGVVDVVARWCFIAWRPRLMFSLAALKPLFCFGWKLTVSALLDRTYSNLYGVIIGRYYSPADLAYVNKGRHAPELLMNNVDSTLGRVVYPALAQMQDDRIRVREAMRKMMIVSTFLVFPLMVLCGLTADRALLVLYGNQWGPSVPYMWFACFAFALWPFHTINLRGLNAIGRSDMFLKLEIVKKLIGLVTLLICIPRGVLVYMAADAVICGPLSVVVNAWPNRKLLKYTLGMQVRDVLPTMLVTISAAVPAFIAGTAIPRGSILLLVLGIVVQCGAFGVFYLVLSYVFKLRPMKELYRIVPGGWWARLPKLKRILDEQYDK